MAIDETYEWLKKGAGLHEHQGKLNRERTTYKINTDAQNMFFWYHPQRVFGDTA